MNSRVWLPLIEYSGRYRVSMSTLRRRIKAGEIEYKFADGKYFIMDGPLDTSSGTETIAPPTQMSQVQGNQKAAEVAKPKVTMALNSVTPIAASGVATASAPTPAATPLAPTSEPSQKGYWEATQTLLAEIKKAYSLILQEKEEQILQLKEEVSDLKTLVRVLEDETVHQKKKSVVKTDFDLDLDLGLDI